ncbi:hypothetical protein [uncultured Nostoc sp.]|uniref:hypothetical protein n=1 Tax=uncultured Nostoc sp. TaxID=340711 RepID=UPI0035CC0952
MTLSAIVDFEPHINAVSRKVRSSKTDDQTFYVMNADNYPKIISMFRQLSFITADQR